MDTEFLTTDQTAKLLGVKVDTLAHWRVRRRGPKFLRLEGRVVYPSRELGQYIRARLVGSGSPSRSRSGPEGAAGKGLP